MVRRHKKQLLPEAEGALEASFFRTLLRGLFHAWRIAAARSLIACIRLSQGWARVIEAANTFYTSLTENPVPAFPSGLGKGS